MDTKKSKWAIAIVALVLTLSGLPGDSKAVAANLFANPSLETGGVTPDSWQKNAWGTNTTTFTYPVAGQEGSRAAQVAMTKYTNGDAKWFPNEVPVTAGQQYTFFDWSKSNVASSVDIQYRNANGSYTYVWLGNVAAKNLWVKFQKTFTVPAGATALTVFHSIKKVGTLSVDNYSLVSPTNTPAPTLTFSAASTSLDYNTSTDLNWSSTNATACTATGAWTGTKAVSGTENTGNLTANKTYTLACSGPGGTTPPQSVTITVAAAPAPTLTFSAASTSLDYNTSTDLNWSSTNATACTATGAWTGTKAVSGTENTGNLTANKTYTLACSGPGGTTPPQSVTLSVAAQQTNLILNPSLEDGTTSPTDWTADVWGTNTTTFTYPVAGHTGLRGATIAMTSHANGDAKWMHKELLTANGKAYQFSSWYNSNAATSFNAQYRMNDGSYEYGWFGDIPSSAGVWKQFSKIIAVPDGAVGIIIFQALATTGSLTVDDYQITEVAAQFPEGMVSLDFDDGWKSVYTSGIPMLNAAGIKSTQYIITESLGDTDYMTQADVLAMAAQGHEIGSHSRTHPDLTTITATQAHDEIFGSRDDLQTMGLTSPKTFTYPFGAYNDSVIQMIKDAGYIGARSVDYGFNIPVSDKYILMDQHLEKTTTVAQVQQWIDQAIANKQWLILEVHEQRTDGDTWSNDPAVLQGIIDYIKQKNVKTVTMSEGIRLMSQ